MIVSPAFTSFGTHISGIPLGKIDSKGVRVAMIKEICGQLSGGRTTVANPGRMAIRGSRGRCGIGW
jgi:hypothetical protein